MGDLRDTYRGQDDVRAAQSRASRGIADQVGLVAQKLSGHIAKDLACALVGGGVEVACDQRIAQNERNNGAGGDAAAIAGRGVVRIRGVPGASFVVANDRFIKTIEKCQTRAYYSNLLKHLKAEEAGRPLFTPAVQVFYAFREAMKEILENGGVQVRIDEYKKIVHSLRSGLKKMNMRFFLPEKVMSNTMTLIYLPRGHNYEILHRSLKKKGYIIYSSAGKLAKDTFRLGTVGVISEKDITKFIEVFKELL